MVVEQPVQGFCATGQFKKVPLECLRERIEQAPHIAWLEILVTRFSPFVEHRGDEAVAADPDIVSADHEIVGGAVVEIGELVVGDAGVLVVPALPQFPDRPMHQTGQITDDEPRVFSGEFHLPAERVG